MVDLRKEARGRECQVRMPGICNHRSETVTLAHIRMAGITGGGQKAPDFLGAWACSDCHNESDRRTSRLSVLHAHFYFYEGVLRTQYALIKEGKIKL